jgi:N-acetylmuramoyl-L-alanine amidase
VHNIIPYMLPILKLGRPLIKLIQVLALVVHCTGPVYNSPKKVYQHFASESRYVSAHFVISNDGDIHQLIPLDEIAYHVGSKTYTKLAEEVFGKKAVRPESIITPNYYSIGIEVCYEVEDHFEPEAVDSLVWLLQDLQQKFPNAVILTHEDIVGWKPCPIQYNIHPEQFEVLKFMVEGCPFTR